MQLCELSSSNSGYFQTFPGNKAKQGKIYPLSVIQPLFFNNIFWWKRENLEIFLSGPIKIQ